MLLYDYAAHVYAYTVSVISFGLTQLCDQFTVGHKIMYSSHISNSKVKSRLFHISLMVISSLGSGDFSHSCNFPFMMPHRFSIRFYYGLQRQFFM